MSLRNVFEIDRAQQVFRNFGSPGRLTPYVEHSRTPLGAEFIAPASKLFPKSGKVSNIQHAHILRIVAAHKQRFRAISKVQSYACAAAAAGMIAQGVFQP